MKPYTRRDRGNSQRGRGLCNRQVIQRDKLKHRPLRLRDGTQSFIQLPCRGLSIQTLVDAGQVIRIKQRAADDRALRTRLLRSRSVTICDSMASDPEQPRSWCATPRRKRSRRPDCCEKHISRQISRNLRVRDTARDEPLNRVNVLTVKTVERLGVRTDRANQHMRAGIDLRLRRPTHLKRPDMRNSQRRQRSSDAARSRSHRSKKSQAETLRR